MLLKVAAVLVALVGNPHFIDVIAKVIFVNDTSWICNANISLIPNFLKLQFFLYLVRHKSNT